MPTVTIDDRTVEVESGTNLVDAALKVGVQIPHYCYHPRLSVVGQCRMCLVKIEGMPKLQAACSTQVVKDGMVVSTQDPEVQEGQKAIMEFLLINHPLDCPICDQAGECGLQDYAFKHGVAFSRFEYEDKRTYSGKERIPLGPNILLNMNRCIQCTRCVRFTHEVAKTGELGFFQRGARAEIGVFPGKQLDSDLATNVVDICPVGALTSTKFRFAERVWYLDKKPSICTGCDVGCNVTLEHRRGVIKRYKPRHNPEVNDYWMCDYGRSTFEKYTQRPRLSMPRLRRGGEPVPVTWNEAVQQLGQQLRARSSAGAVAVLGSGELTTEEAYLFAKLADAVGTPHRSVYTDASEPWHIPNPKGGVTGREGSPNRRGAEMAGLARPKGDVIDHERLLSAEGAEGVSILIATDSDYGPGAWDPTTVERLRKAQFLVVFGWADSPLAQAADLALPVATHAEKDGSFVNVQWRLQRFRAAFPSPGAARPTTEILTEVLAQFDESWHGMGVAEVFDRMAAEIGDLEGMRFERLPASGVALREPETVPATA